jgi:hypothetical protein
MSSPVIILVKAKGCPACTSFAKIWDKGRMMSTSVLTAIKKVTPDVRIVEINLPTMGSKVPSNIPSAVNNFLSWFPMVMFVPGQTWDNAMKDLSKNTPLYGVKVFNGSDDTGTLTHVNEFDNMKASDYTLWMEKIKSGAYRTYNPDNDVPLMSIEQGLHSEIDHIENGNLKVCKYRIVRRDS